MVMLEIGDYYRDAPREIAEGFAYSPMARNAELRLARKIRSKRIAARRKNLEALETLALALGADAEDEQEELVAATVALLALEEATQLKRDTRSKKRGPRGPYTQKRSEDFFRILLEESSERWFKAWFR